MTALNIGDAAPQFELPDLSEQSVSLSELRDTPVVLFFFRTDCSWCEVEMPKLAEVYRAHSESVVHVLNIAVGEEQNVVEIFLRDKDFDFPILLDHNGQVALNYTLERVPTVVMVSAEGNIERVYEGSAEQLGGIVEQSILAAARGVELPTYSLIGNGCAPLNATN